MPHRPWPLIGLDLEMLLQKGSPNLKALGTLTLFEPLATNLGDSDITLAKLSPGVKGQGNESAVVWIHAYERCSPELWTELVPREDNIARKNGLNRVAFPSQNGQT